MSYCLAIPPPPRPRPLPLSSRLPPSPPSPPHFLFPASRRFRRAALPAGSCSPAARRHLVSPRLEAGSAHGGRRPRPPLSPPGARCWWGGPVGIPSPCPSVHEAQQTRIGTASTARARLCLGSWVPKGGTPNGQGWGRTAGHSPMAPRCPHLTSFLQGPQPSGVWGHSLGTRPPPRDWVRAGAEPKFMGSPRLGNSSGITRCSHRQPKGGCHL